MSSEPAGPVINGRPSKSVVVQPATIVASEPWWANGQIRWALIIIVAGIAGFLHAFGWIPALSDERIAGIVALICSAGGVVWIVKRLRFGKDPANPASPITLT